MADQIFINGPWQAQGPANLYLYDQQDTSWAYMGRIADPKITMDSTKIAREEIRARIAKKTGEMVVGQTASLECTLLECDHPRVLNMMLQSAGQTQTFTAGPLCREFTKKHELFRVDSYLLQHRAGWATLARLAPISGVVASQAGSAGTGWTTGANTFYVVPLYGTTLPNAGVPAGADTNWADYIDIKGHFTGGTPKQITGSTINIGSATATITLCVTLPALTRYQPLPDGYAVFQYTGTATAVTQAKLAAWATNTITRAGGTQSIAVTKPANAGSSAYTAPQGFSIRREANYTTTPTYTKMTNGTDYTYSQTDGSYVRIVGGAIPNGETVQITEWYIKPSNIATPIGAETLGTDYRTMLIERLNPQEIVSGNAVGETVLEEGAIIQLDRVNIAGLMWEWGISEKDFYKGTPFKAEVLQGASGAFGTSTVYGADLYNWVENYGEIS